MRQSQQTLRFLSVQQSYWITPSARPSSGNGTVIPSALAVLRLMINSTFEDWMSVDRGGPLRSFRRNCQPGGSYPFDSVRSSPDARLKLRAL